MLMIKIIKEYEHDRGNEELVSELIYIYIYILKVHDCDAKQPGPWNPVWRLHLSSSRCLHPKI